MVKPFNIMYLTLYILLVGYIILPLSLSFRGNVHRFEASTKKLMQKTDYFTTNEIEKYASLSGLSIIAKETGPVLRLEIFSDTDSETCLGYLTAFIRPFPIGLFHLETIQAVNRRQVLGFTRKNWTVEGPGLSFLMGSWALRWAFDKGCSRTELLAVKDSEDMHRILVRLYKSFGFTKLRDVDEDFSDRIVWGAVGTLMTMDIQSFLSEWTPKLKQLTSSTATKNQTNLP